MSLLFALAACTGGATTTSTTDTSDRPSLADDAYAMLIGHFDSTAQSQSDREYYAISLKHCPVDLPELGERTLYVEQALSDTPSDPYRQRLYTVHDRDDGTATTRLYELADPDAVINACDDLAAATWDLEGLTELEGCGVVLAPNDDGFTGSTIEDSCLSDYSGATYATAQVTLSPTELTSWDQGWSDDDEQVWGATAGPYVFDRLSETDTW